MLVFNSTPSYWFYAGELSNISSTSLQMTYHFSNGLNWCLGSFCNCENNTGTPLIFSFVPFLFALLILSFFCLIIEIFISQIFRYYAKTSEYYDVVNSSLHCIDCDDNWPQCTVNFTISSNFTVKPFKFTGTFS